MIASMQNRGVVSMAFPWHSGPNGLLERRDYMHISRAPMVMNGDWSSGCANGLFLGAQEQLACIRTYPEMTMQRATQVPAALHLIRVSSIVS